MLGPLMARWVLPGCTRDVGRRFGNRIALVALGGALLGFTISIRQVGALAGLLVSLYWIYRMRGRRAWLLGAYWAAAACLTLATWPYLWASPLLRFWESLTVAADFEIHMTPYRGDWVFSDRLPWHYFPTLASLELTEPVVALFLGGVGVAIWRWVSHDINRCMMLILILWLGIPLFGLIVMGMGAYNNIRQLHFVLVPVFLIAGIGLAALLAAVKKVWIETSLFVLLLLPGMTGIVKLHPYEYTYFNALAGGIEGAEGQYAQDYWCTSYREAMAYVNEAAEPGAKVMAMGPLRSALSFAREDLEVLRNEGDRSVRGVDYLLTCYRWLGVEWDARAGLERVHTVGRGSVVFAEVFRRTKGDTAVDD
jgi:MFS family permease